jgi:multidrug resistance efflux pump
MKPKPQIIVPVVLIVLGISGYFIDQSRDKRQAALSGFFESQPTKVASRIMGRVARITVKEGDTVKRGQVLAIMEADSVEADTNAKKALAMQAEEAAKEAINGSRPEDISRQEAIVAESQATLNKLHNGPLPEEIKAARNKLTQAEARYRKAIAGPRKEEIAQARAAERQARARLDQAQRGLTTEERAQIKARFDAARAQERLAEANWQRADRLYKEGAISKQAWDQAQAAFDSAQSVRRDASEANDRAQKGTPKEELDQAKEAYRQAKAGLDLVLAGTRKEDLEAAKADVDIARESLKLLTNGTRKEDIAAGVARLSQAQAALALVKKGAREEMLAQVKAAAKAADFQAQSATKTVGEKVIVAPCDGVVDRVLVADGDLIPIGTPVVQLSDPSDIWLRVYVPEAQLAKVKVADDADLLIDGVNGIVTGVVESIATRGEFTPANLQTPDERGKQVYAVRIRLKQPDPRVKSGMYVSVKRVGEFK